MTTRARITADFPSEKDVASRLRVPTSRAAVLTRQVFDIASTDSAGKLTVIEVKRNGSRAGEKTQPFRRSQARAKKK